MRKNEIKFSLTFFLALTSTVVARESVQNTPAVVPATQSGTPAGAVTSWGLTANGTPSNQANTPECNADTKPCSDFKEVECKHADTPPECIQTNPKDGTKSCTRKGLTCCYTGGSVDGSGKYKKTWVEDLYGGVEHHFCICKFRGAVGYYLDEKPTQDCDKVCESNNATIHAPQPDCILFDFKLPAACMLQDSGSKSTAHRLRAYNEILGSMSRSLGCEPQRVKQPAEPSPN